jgi:hypothetical protein
MSEVKTLEVVAIVTELEEPTQFGELVTLVKQGYTEFLPIDGGLALLSKTPVTGLVHRDNYEISSLCRFAKSGDRVEIETTDGRALVLHVYTIREDV